MKVLFFPCQFPREMPHFTRGLAEVGAQVYSIGETPESELPESVRRYLSGYMRVPSLMDERAVVASLARLARDVRFDLVESLWEPTVILAARLREMFGARGMSVETVEAFRDKATMRAKVAAAGLRSPRTFRARTAAEVHEAAEKTGYPLIVKPIAGAGSKDTYRVDSPADLEKTLSLVGHLREASIEEYIDGEEFTFDAVSVNGVPRFYSIMQYHPKPLIGRSNEWISPAQFTFRDLTKRKLQGGIMLGHGVLRALGMGTGFTHMEWFLTPSGEAVFGEIGARVGGGVIADMINYSNDIDIFREWARTVCWHDFGAEPSRAYNVGLAFKRALGQGRISGYQGLDRVRAKLGRWMVAEELLPIGSPRRNWIDTLLSDGYLCVRHPNEEVCFEMMKMLVNDVKVYANG